MKKKKRNAVKVTIVPILNDEYKVYILRGDKQKVTNWLNKYYEINDIDAERDFDGYRAKCFYSYGYHPCIYVKGKNNYASLAHEAIHAVDFIFKFIEQKDYGEVFAHSVSAIVRAIEDEKQS